MVPVGDCKRPARSATVMNCAPDFVVQAFGDAGKHVRTAVGVAALAMNITASVYMIVELE